MVTYFVIKFLTTQVPVSNIMHVFLCNKRNSDSDSDSDSNTELFKIVQIIVG